MKSFQTPPRGVQYDRWFSRQQGGGGAGGGSEPSPGGRGYGNSPSGATTLPCGMIRLRCYVTTSLQPMNRNVYAFINSCHPMLLRNNTFDFTIFRYILEERYRTSPQFAVHYACRINKHTHRGGRLRLLTRESVYAMSMSRMTNRHSVARTVR